MAYTELVAETIQHIRAGFTPTLSDVKKYIDILLEKEFLERLDNDILGYLA
jgi:cullin 1